jgi:HAD superfamily 5'-nucleotidase-like hydrolase
MSDSLSVPLPPLPPAPGRGLYCNRTLNLRAIKAVGFDMDYTLVHYNVDVWERRAHEYIAAKLLEHRWPIDDVEFLPGFATRGLVIDTVEGNLLKADRFGYVKRATHGTRRLEFDEQRRLYTRTLVDLDEPRWVFLNTFFSLSEAGMYAQLVDRLDAGRLPPGLNYRDLWLHVHRALDEAHAEGRMKTEIGSDPAAYLVADPDVGLALLDQKHAGKKLLLITNSEWPFTRAIMKACLEPWLPAGLTWQSLFDLVIVGARKPEFFSGRSPLFRVVNEQGLLEPCVAGPTGPGVYLGGHAELVEEYLGVSGAEILYVGDHLYTDVRVSKDIRRWRTGLIVRELEDELADRQARRLDQVRLDQLMGEKALAEYEQAQWRLLLQRAEQGYGPASPAGRDAIESRLGRLRSRLEKLDDETGPLAVALGSLSNRLWGPLMYAGNDRSLLASQVEMYADVYMSRVSNLLAYTPFAYLRAPRGTLPHDV